MRLTLNALTRPNLTEIIDKIPEILNWIQDEPFRLVAVLCIGLSAIIYAFFRNEHPYFKVFASLLIFLGIIGLVYALIIDPPTKETEGNGEEEVAEYSDLRFSANLVVLGDELPALTRNQLNIWPMRISPDPALSQTIVQEEANKSVRCKAVIEAYDFGAGPLEGRYQIPVDFSQLDLLETSVNDTLELGFFHGIKYDSYELVQGSNGIWERIFVGSGSWTGGISSYELSNPSNSERFQARLDRLLATFISLGKMCQDV